MKSIQEIDGYFIEILSGHISYLKKFINSTVSASNGCYLDQSGEAEFLRGKVDKTIHQIILINDNYRHALMEIDNHDKEDKE